MKNSNFKTPKSHWSPAHLKWAATVIKQFHEAINTHYKTQKSMAKKLRPKSHIQVCTSSGKGLLTSRLNVSFSLLDRQRNHIFNVLMRDQQSTKLKAKEVDALEGVLNFLDTVIYLSKDHHEKLKSM